MTQQAKLVTAIVAATVVVFAGLAFLLTATPAGAPVPNGTVSFDDQNAIAEGKADAAVVVRMYSDFQCPACKAAEGPLQTIRREFADRVKFIWKDFPLLAIHPNARVAANAARCANAQGKFWEFHDRLYANQEAWAGVGNPKDRFVQFAREAGLNEGEFTACYDDRRFDGQVMDDVREGEANGVDSTPTFYVGQTETQARTEAQWRAVLESALRAVPPAATASSTTSTVPTP